MLTNEVFVSDDIIEGCVNPIKRVNSHLEAIREINLQISVQLTDKNGWSGKAHDEYVTLFENFRNYFDEVCESADLLEHNLTSLVNSLDDFTNSEPLVQKIRQYGE